MSIQEEWGPMCEGRLGKIERIGPVITVEQLLELVKIAVSSKTNELELAVARSIEIINSPPFMMSGDTPS